MIQQEQSEIYRNKNRNFAGIWQILHTRKQYLRVNTRKGKKRLRVRKFTRSTRTKWNLRVKSELRKPRGSRDPSGVLGERAGVQRGALAAPGAPNAGPSRVVGPGAAFAAPATDGLDGMRRVKSDPWMEEKLKIESGSDGYERAPQVMSGRWMLSSIWKA